MTELKKQIRRQYFTGERPLFMGENLKIIDTIFTDGESPLKESRNIELYGSMFKWKYPLWYSENVSAENCAFFEMARAGIWYTKNISLKDCAYDAPKGFRRCDGVTVNKVSFPNASETLWSCKNVRLSDVEARGDYFAMNCENMEVDGLTLYGNYSFDGVKNATISNSKLLSKDSFWNSENVTVKNCFISGEYLGWNAKNLTLIDCTIESLQGLCYIDNLVMRNCKLINTTLAFEYSSVDAEIDGAIDSIINPSEGRITCESIGELILEKDKVDVSKTKIVCKNDSSDGCKCKCRCCGE